MAQQPDSPYGLRADSDHHVVPFRARAAARVQPAVPEQAAGGPSAGLGVRVKRHAIRQVVLLEVDCRLSDVVHDLDQAIQLALADGPRGVVCNLSGVLEGLEPDAVEILASAGRHVRDWPAIPVAIACANPQVRAALAAHPQGRYLIVTASILPALSAVLEVPAPAVQRLRLAPHPTSPRASREFVTRTLLDWQLGRVIRLASLAVSELVFISTTHAGTDIDLTVAWNLGALRLTVQDNSPDLPSEPHPAHRRYGRGLAIVDGLSRAFGVLPTSGGGKVVWAVLNAARPGNLGPATAPHESPVLTHDPCPADHSHKGSASDTEWAERSTPVGGREPCPHCRTIA